MKILVISPYFYPHIGGSEQYALSLHAQLKKQHPNIQIEVLTYNTNHTKTEEAYRGLRIYRVPAIQLLKDQLAIPNYWAVWQILKKLKGAKSWDIVNAQTRFFDSAIWGIWAAKYLGAKKILTDHCAGHPYHASFFIRGLAKLFDLLFISYFAKAYDQILVSSKATQTFWKNILGFKNTTILPGGAGADIFSPKKSPVIRTFSGVNRKFTPKDTVILFLGRFIASKNPLLILKAARQLEKSYPRLVFLFAGSGPLTKKVSRSNLKNVNYLGDLDKTAVSKVLSQTDIVVHPSIHPEGLPNVILEAGVSRNAVIAVGTGGVKELIIHGKTGLLIKPNVQSLVQAIITLAQKPSLRNIIAQKLYKMVSSRYNWNQTAKDYYLFLKRYNKM